MFLNFCLTFLITNFRNSHVWRYNMLHYGLVITDLFKIQNWQIFSTHVWISWAIIFQTSPPSFAPSLGTKVMLPSVSCTIPSTVFAVKTGSYVSILINSAVNCCSRWKIILVLYRYSSKSSLPWTQCTLYSSPVCALKLPIVSSKTSCQETFIKCR